MTGHLVADSNNRLENLVNSREYLHTFVRLFAAASAGFDPIGMHPNQSPAVPSQFTSYIQEARNAFASDETATAGMKNSFDFMKEKFEIGPESRKGDGAAIPTSAENVTSSSAWDLDVQVEYHKIPQTLFPLQDDNCSSQYDFVDSRPDSPATPLRKSGSRMKRRANSPPDDLGFPGVRSSTESLNEKFKQHSLSRKASSSSMNSAFEDDEDRIYSEVKGRLTVAEVQSLELSFLQNPKPTSFKKRELAEQMMVDVARINVGCCCSSLTNTHTTDKPRRTGFRTAGLGQSSKLELPRWTTPTLKHCRRLRGNQATGPNEAMPRQSRPSPRSGLRARRRCLRA